ncbi:MAG TPA: UPF0262 family protein [Azospirillaceae bacterium]|nr:UPF0262 family protein [Azospirillaceae bacterium]
MSERRNRIVHVELVERHIVRRRPEVEHERAVALFDLLEENEFTLPDFPDAGPFRLLLSIEENRLAFDVRDEQDAPLTRVVLALTPLRTIVRDYFMICDSYYKAIKTASPSQIEAIDMGRRGLHDEGSTVLRERLSGKIEVDHGTARRLFTLICVLHIRG